MSKSLPIALFMLAAPLMTWSAADAGEKTSEAVVKFATKVEKSAAGKAIAVIDLDIQPGWHLYANPAGHADYDGSSVVVKGAVAVEYPAGKNYVDEQGNKVKVYQGKAQIRAVIEPTASGAVELIVAVQACSDGEGSVCLPPAKVKLTVR